MKPLWVIIDLVFTALLFSLLFLARALLVEINTLFVYYLAAILSFLLMLAATAIRKAMKIDLRKTRFPFLLLVFFFIIAIVRLVFEKDAKGINWAFVLIILNTAVPIVLDLKCLFESINKDV